MSILEIDKVFKSFEGNKVLNGVSFEVETGSSLVILGRSGEGKSILFKIILALIELDSGDVRVSGLSVKDRSKRSEYISNFSMLFQSSALFDSMTVLENVMFPLLEKGENKIDAQKYAKYTLSHVGIGENSFYIYPSELSGGMQKRVALARVIVNKPEIILFDEPTSGLDPITGSMITKVIKDVIDDLKTTSLTITHDISAAKHIADNIAFIKQGEIIWYGSKPEFKISTNKEVQSFIEASKL